MPGASIGDIVGSIYEFNNHRSRQFEFYGPGAKRSLALLGNDAPEAASLLERLA